MTNETLILTLVAAVLIGTERLLATDMRWFPTLSGGWRALAASACGVPIYLFELVIGGSDWVTAGWKTALTVGVPLLLSLLTLIGKPETKAEVKSLPVKSEPSNPVPPAAALLLLGLVAWGTSACAGSLEMERAQARLTRLGPVAVAAEPTRAPECKTYDTERKVWSGVMWTGLGIVAASAAGGVLDAKVQDLSHEQRANWGVGLAVAGGVGATAAGLGKVEVDLADAAWARDCSQ